MQKLEQSNESRPSWDETFMDIAKVVAKRSKDPHTKVGCVIVKDGRILSIGYNGEPRQFNYHFDWSSTEKYDYVIHAELNAIANANYNGVSVKDSTVYLTLSPCKDCIKLLAQHGIRQIFYLDEYKDFDKTKFIAANANVVLTKLWYKINKSVSKLIVLIYIQ